MTLPKETIEAIEKDASDKTKAKEVEIKERFYKYSPNKIAYLDGYETGRIDGATEWAGNVQPVVDMLETTISILSAFIEPVLWNQEISNEQIILINTRRGIENTLAKYKEVTNG